MVPHRLTASRWPIGIAVVLLLAAVGTLLWSGRSKLATVGWFPNSDFHTYYKAGAMVRLGLARDGLYPPPAPGESPMFHLFKADAAELERVNRLLPEHLQVPAHTYGGFAYPPFPALMMVPLSLLPVEVAGLVWRGLLLVLSGAGLWALHRVLVGNLGVSPLQSIAILLACVVTWPFLFSIRMGQAGQLVFVSAAFTVFALASNRLGLAGVALGLGALIKLFPAVVLVLFWRPAHRRVIAWAVATMLAGTAATSLFVSPFDVVRFYRDLGPYLHQGTGGLNNQSLTGFLVHMGMSPASRAGLIDDPTLMPLPLRLGARLATTALLLGAIWVCARPGRRRVTEAGSNGMLFDVALLSTVAVLASPLSWPYTFVGALVAYALWLGTIAARGRGAGPWPFLGAVALQLLWLVPPNALPATWGATPAARLLLNPTFYAGAAVLWLMWRWGGRVTTPALARP